MLRCCSMLFFTILLLLTQQIFAQTIPKTLLVHSRYDPGDTSSEMVIGYTFHRGKHTGTDTLLWLKRYPGSKTESDISTGLGGDRLIQDRYLFTTKGRLIDLQEKKLLRDINGELWKIEGNKLYFSSRYHLDKVGLEMYDLTDQSFKQGAVLPFKNSRHLVSPDLRYGLQRVYKGNEKWDVEVVDATGKRKLIIADTSNYLRIPGFDGGGTQLPLAWIDSDHFVLPSYIRHPRDGIVWSSTPRSHPGEQVFGRPLHDTLSCCSVELTAINIHTGERRFIATLNDVYAPKINDRMYTLNGMLWFRNKGLDSLRYFRIDPVSGIVKEGNDIPGNHFYFAKDSSRAREANKGYADKIYYEGVPVGSFFVRRYFSSDDIIVIEASEDEGKQSSLWIWSADARTWNEIHLERFLSFFGWINPQKKNDE